VAEPAEVTTVLGPCVSATLWCRRSRLAAICHAMLPTAPPAGRPRQDGLRGKYVDEVIPEMILQFMRKAGRPLSYEVKLFGGADLLDHPAHTAGARIGSQNVEIARELLSRHRLALTAFDVGGNTGRKLIFDTLTGQVRVKHLPKHTLA
jgi:chemotaxis protein CheD